MARRRATRGECVPIAGVSLGETLADVDGLTAVLPGLATEVLHRAVSLGWADRMMAPRPPVFDPLTGLVSADYLRTRMGEVYRAADVADTKVSATHALVVVRVDLTGRTGWDRITPLILSGDAMRTVFDGGQTLARLADHMAVALCRTRGDAARGAPNCWPGWSATGWPGTAARSARGSGSSGCPIRCRLRST